ncbi:MAG: hypothetical protein M0R80_30050 [Proteobacteria bacterium]|jgi:hypothetical protein|nr:hypothetical protein [Pseudomonadota bacterium]
MIRSIAVLVSFTAALCGSSAGAEEAGPEPPPMRRVEEALVLLPDEPSLAALERAALRRADADAESVRRLPASVHAAAALPAIKLSVDRDVGRDESLDRYQDEPDRWGADTDRGIGLSASAEWKLNELVFDPDEVRVYDLLGDRADRREALLTMLVGAYFERRQLLLTELLLPATTAEEAIARRIRIDELTAVIDALTGGLLSRNLKRRSVDAGRR